MLHEREPRGGGRLAEGVGGAPMKTPAKRLANHISQL